MKNKIIIGLLTCTVLVGQVITYPVYAKTNTQNYDNQKVETANEQIASSNGLMGYYFADEHFKDLQLMAPVKSGELKFEKNKVEKLLTEEKTNIKSIRWTGRIIPSKDGEYTLSTDKNNVLMQINAEGEIANTLKVNMTKGQEYNIRIEIQDKGLGYVDDLSSPKLYWELNGDKTLVPEKNLFLRDYSKIDANDPFIPKDNFFDLKLKSRSARSVSGWGDEDLDTDNDNIPDAYEKNGYTIKDSIAVKWEDSFAQQGYKKYLSSYLESNTAGESLY